MAMVSRLLHNSKMSSGKSLDVVISSLLETKEFSVREGYLVVDHVTLIKLTLYFEDIAI